TGFGGLVGINGSNVAFLGTYGGGQGIYSSTVGATGATKIVDFGNVAAGHGAFTGFGNPAISGNNVAFLGLYSGGRGIYRGTVGATAATKIVEIGDTAPGHGVFTDFRNSPSISGNTVAFVGLYPGGRGLYL